MNPTGSFLNSFYNSSKISLLKEIWNSIWVLKCENVSIKILKHFNLFHLWMCDLSIWWDGEIKTLEIHWKSSWLSVVWVKCLFTLNLRIIYLLKCFTVRVGLVLWATRLNAKITRESFVENLFKFWAMLCSDAIFNDFF